MCTVPHAPPCPQHSRPLLVPHGAQDEGWLPGPGDLRDVLQFCGAQGRVGRAQAGAGPPPPLPFWGQTWSCALTPLSLAGTSASHSLQGLFIAEYNWPLGEQWAWNTEGSPPLWAWPPICLASSRFSCIFPPEPRSTSTPALCAVCPLHRAFLHACQPVLRTTTFSRILIPDLQMRLV